MAFVTAFCEEDESLGRLWLRLFVCFGVGVTGAIHELFFRLQCSMLLLKNWKKNISVSRGWPSNLLLVLWNKVRLAFTTVDVGWRVRWGEGRWGKVKEGEVRWGKVRWGEGRWGKGRWRKVRWGKVRLRGGNLRWGWDEARWGGGELREGEVEGRWSEVRLRRG